VKHPDKNKGNPAATAEFVELKKAYDALTDEAARGALDDFVRRARARAGCHPAAARAVEGGADSGGATRRRYPLSALSAGGCPAFSR